MKVSIVISAYNEEKRIDKTLPRVIEYCREFRKKYSVDTEIVIVDSLVTKKIWERDMD
jgi:glycosyltransferase involved in cell wall biosynthesis